MSAAPAQPATVTIAGCTLHYDAGRPVSLAVPLDFNGAGPGWFSAPAPRCEPLVSGGFSGRVASGASCNCSTLHLTPHCDGTHTECAGHLTLEPLHARDCLPAGRVPALLLTLVPERVGPQGLPSGESTRPAPRRGDRLLTRAALVSAWPEPLRALGVALPVAPRALVLRTGGAPAASASASGDTLAGAIAVAPYLSLAAAEWLVERAIEHLVLELPSADRAEDEGQLAAHRVFFGLAAGSSALADVRRGHCTITELARVPPSLADGFGLLSLEAPALAGDALPSRPLWHVLLARSAA
jgi:hypothetical protein